MSLLQIDAEVESLNRGWIRMLASSYSRFSIESRPGGGHLYILEDVVPKQQQVVAEVGPLCGDNGGKTTKGTPCKRKAGIDGRCKSHPVITAAKEGSTIRRMVVDFGDDADPARPIPDPDASWQITADGIPYTPEISDRVVHYPAQAEWNRVLLDTHELLNLPPVGVVRINGHCIWADPLWTIKRFRQEYHLKEITTIGSKSIEPTRFLIDYGVQEYGDPVDIET